LYFTGTQQLKTQENIKVCHCDLSNKKHNEQQIKKGGKKLSHYSKNAATIEN